MAKQRASAQDVDLLMLIREESVYAGRIREALVFSESKIQRLESPLVERDQAYRELQAQRYVRPESAAEKIEEEDAVVPRIARKPCKTKVKIAIRDEDVKGSLPYTNPAIDRRRTVEDNDAVFSESGTGQARVEFTYDDLVATREGRKITTVRALRRLANLWGINPKLNKEEMLTQLIIEYARRYRDEVLAYEERRTTTRSIKIRKRGRRR
jgi:hypothetical protein